MPQEIKTSPTSIIGEIEATSQIMKFGNTNKVGFKIGDNWYNLIGKESFLQEQIAGIKNSKRVQVSYEIKPWTDNTGEMHEDYRIKTIGPVKDKPLSQEEPEKSAAVENLQGGKPPERETIIRRLALLKIAAIIENRCIRPTETSPSEHTELVKIIAEDLERWVMA